MRPIEELARSFEYPFVLVPQLLIFRAEKLNKLFNVEGGGFWVSSDAHVAIKVVLSAVQSLEPLRK